jgi:pimeloyl-ACP methyl ester carboxylesterase
VLSALPGGLLGVRHGQQPARVVALHGWRRTSADFAAVLAGIDAVAPDLPGFGAAPAPEAVWGSADYAEAILPLCEEGGPVVVVGHSFGGRVAVMLAAAHPAVVAGLVLTGTPLWRPAGAGTPRPPLRYRVARQLHRVGLVGDAQMERQRRRTGSEDYRAATGVMRDVLVRVIAETNDGTYRRALATIGCPIDLVWGELDTSAPADVAREAETVTGTARVTLLPGIGHLTPTEAPSALADAISRQLST